MLIDKIKFIRKNIKCFVILFFVAHFILQFVFMILGFFSVMAFFENPDSQFLSIKNTIYNYIFNILSFPFVFMFSRVLYPFEILYESSTYRLFILLGEFAANSLLWSIGFYFLLKKICIKSNENNNKTK